jgi:hypothetical protein
MGPHNRSEEGDLQDLQEDHANGLGLERITMCKHEYEGSFEKGWTCRICKNYSKTVHYYETVDGQKKGEAIKKAKADLKADVGKLISDGLNRGLALALDVIQKPGQTLDGANDEISFYLGEMMKENWPGTGSKGASSEKG